MKKFLLLGGFPDSLVRFRGHLMNELLNLGLEVHAAAPGLSASSVCNILKARGILVHDFPLARAGINPLQDVGTLWRLYQLMRCIQPDAMLAYTVKPVIYGLLAARLAHVPQRFALITGLGYAFTESNDTHHPKRRVLRHLVEALYRLALGSAHKVFFQNSDDEKLFRKRGILPALVPSRVVHGSGVPLDEFVQTPVPETPSFLMIARLLGDKGVREYAAAAFHVRVRFPEARFVLAGWLDANPDSISAQELEEWVRTGTLQYLGQLEDVRPAIAQCSVYVLPSYREGTPRTVLEAMAMGRAIITTDAPGCRETVISGENGFLVPVQSVDALVHAMMQFLETPELAQRMGKRSRQLAEEKYDVRKVNTVLLQEMGLTI